MTPMWTALDMLWSTQCGAGG